MKQLTFTVELLEPMLSTGLEGDPNAGVSADFIAGSVLRGAVIGRYLSENNLPELSLNTDERNLFFNEKVYFQNAYPLENDKSGLPVPLSWQKEKDAEDAAGFYDFCFAKVDKTKQYKNIGSPFFAFDGGNVLKIEPKKRLAVHTKRDAEKGRSTSDDGAVFRYESVAEGTKFKGTIASETEGFLTVIKDLIHEKKILLGGSRTAGYGLAQIVCDDIFSEKISGTVEKISSGQEFTILLSSNALIRDKNGHFQSELTAASLGLNEAKIEFEKVFKRNEFIGGFNRKWGLPLPQQISIKSGSIFLCRAKTDIQDSIVKNWLEKGIGERKAEGFGQIAFDVNRNKSATFSFKASEPMDLTDIDLKNDLALSPIAKKMNERILRSRFEAKLLEKVGKIEPANKPRNSQISRLRLVVREAISEKSADKITAFFGADNLRKTSRSQFEAMRVEGKKLEDWITEVLKTFPVKVNQSELPKIGNASVADDLAEEIKLEFNLRLIDGVLKNAAKGDN